MEYHDQINATLVETYTDLTEMGGFHFDEMQLNLTRQLDLFANELQSYVKDSEKRGFLRKVLKKSKRQKPVMGFYIYGGVGRGKTMLMDLLFKKIKISSKKRFHFHEFMRDVHEEIRVAREKKIADPIELVAGKIFENISLICFDEMQITDIADAMLVGRLFEKIVNMQISFICTSNRKPGDLYKDGLNRELFLPFIDLLESNLKVFPLNADRDYRRDLLKGSEKYFVVSNPNSHDPFQKLWVSLTRGDKALPFEIKIGTRTLIIPYFINGIGRLSFKDLCGQPLSSREYLSMINEIKVLFLEDIPIFCTENLDSSKRFMNLIDVIYENQVRFICTAEDEPSSLYRSKRGAFEFERTISRLEEMRSANWPSAEK